MRTSDFTEAQSIATPKQTDASALVKTACRQAGTCFGLSQALWCAPPVGWTVRDAELITEIARFAG